MVLIQTKEGFFYFLTNASSIVLEVKKEEPSCCSQIDMVRC